MELVIRDKFKRVVIIDYHSQFTVLQHSFDVSATLYNTKLCVLYMYVLLTGVA